ELQQQGNLHGLQAIIEQAKILIAGGFAQELQAEGMHRSSGQVARSVEAGIYVGEIDGQESVVIADGGTQKERLFLIEAQGEARQVAGFRVEEAEARSPDRFDVSVTIEYGEGVAVLEHARSVVR